jgi:DsbE subfamily thiol:disulfide oxidoreductase
MRTVGWVASVALWAVVALCCEIENAISENAPAPTWKLQSLDGKSVRFDDFKGKVVILDFWATWCGPCREEIPGLIDLQKKYEKQGLAVVGISLDDGDAEVVKAFVRKLGMNYPVLLGDDKVQQAFGGIDAIPATFVIDRHGHIVKKYVGLVEKKQLEAVIKPLLKT